MEINLQNKIKIKNKLISLQDLYLVSLELSTILKKTKSYQEYLMKFNDYFEKVKLKNKEEIKKWLTIFNYVLINPNYQLQKEVFKDHNKSPFLLLKYAPIERMPLTMLWYFFNLEDSEGNSISNKITFKALSIYGKEEKYQNAFKDNHKFVHFFKSPEGVFQFKEVYLETIEEIKDLIIQSKTKKLLEKFVETWQNYSEEEKKEFYKALNKFIQQMRNIKEAYYSDQLPNFTVFFPLYPFVLNPELKDLFINQSWNSFFDLYFKELDNAPLSFYSSLAMSNVEGWLYFAYFFALDSIYKETTKKVEVVLITRPQRIKDIKDLRKRFALLKAVEEFTYNTLLDDLGNFENILKGEFKHWEIYQDPFIGKPLIRLKEQEFTIPYKLYDKQSNEFIELEENVVFNMNYNYYLIKLVYLAFKPVIDYIKKSAQEDNFSILKLRDIYYNKVEHKLKFILYEKIPNDPVMVDYLNYGIVQAVSTVIQFVLDNHFETIKKQMKELISFYIQKVDFVKAVFSRFARGYSTLNYIVGATRTGKSLTAIMMAELISFLLAGYVNQERKEFEGVKQGDIIFSVWRHLIYNFRRLYVNSNNLNHFVVDEIVGTLHKSAFMSKVQRRFATFIDTQAVRRSILWLVLPQFSSISKEIRAKGNFLLWKERRDKLRIYYLIKQFISQNDNLYSPKIEELYQRHFKFLPVLPHNFLSYNLIEADGKNKLKREISKSAEEMELSF